MNIDTIKKYLYKYKDKKLRFKYNCGRGQIDEFNGVITNIYDRIFIIKLDDGKIKSFNFSDILIKNLNFTII